MDRRKSYPDCEAAPVAGFSLVRAFQAVDVFTPMKHRFIRQLPVRDILQMPAGSPRPGPHPADRYGKLASACPAAGFAQAAIRFLPASSIVSCRAQTAPLSRAYCKQLFLLSESTFAA